MVVDNDLMVAGIEVVKMLGKSNLHQEAYNLVIQHQNYHQFQEEVDILVDQEAYSLEEVAVSNEEEAFKVSKLEVVTY